MKLSIDLADREEIAAAVPLLQLILDNTPKTCGGQCHAQETAVAAPVAPAVPAVPAAPVVAEISQDPAAVFGGAAVPAPLAASIPPIAAAATVAPPPPANTAPITTTLGPASLGAGAASVELDKNGLPWDERIHAGTKTKLKSGEWKAKKQVAPELVASVEAELRARMAAGNVASPVAPTVPTPPLASPVGASSPTTTASPAVAPATDPAAVFGGAPAVPAAPLAPTAVPANNAPTMANAGLPSYPATPGAPAGVSPDTAPPAPATFEQLMPRITAAVTAGIMPPTAVGAACAAHGVASVVTLQQSPQFVPLVWATLRQQYPALA